MDVSLHFGAHRTATTTFQRMMGQNGPNLRAMGFAYWGPKRTRSPLFDGVVRGSAGPFPCVARHRKHAVGRVTRAMDWLEAEGVRRLLVSEENMLGTLRGSLTAGVLYPDAFERARHLSTSFGARCTQIGIGIRSYDDWWSSAVAFCVAKSGPVPSRALCQRLVAQPRRWRDVITDVARAFPQARLRVWSFEAMGARPEAVAQGLLGPELPALTGTRDWHNARPTPAALRGHLADLGQSAAGVVDAFGRFAPFDAQERAILQAQYADDIVWLRSGQDDRITYMDDLGQDPIATGGIGDDQGAFEHRSMG